MHYVINCTMATFTQTLYYMYTYILTNLRVRFFYLFKKKTSNYVNEISIFISMFYILVSCNHRLKTHKAKLFIILNKQRAFFVQVRAKLSSLFQIFKSKVKIAILEFQTLLKRNTLFINSII
jgi:hypothetical protein